VLHRSSAQVIDDPVADDLNVSGAVSVS